MSDIAKARFLAAAHRLARGLLRASLCWTGE
jgi:hypothetical protein